MPNAESVNIRNFYRYDNNIRIRRFTHNLGHEGNILRYEFPNANGHRSGREGFLVNPSSKYRMIMFLTGCLGLFWILFIGQKKYLKMKARWHACNGAWIVSLAPIFCCYALNPTSDVAMTGQIIG